TRVIADYRQILSEDLLHHFVIPWTQWAHKMGSVTRYQAHGSPGNLLDLYGAADIPEMESFGSAHFNIPGLLEDSLYPDNKRATLDPLLLKFSSSAAHVMGRKLASSETFTWLGEHFRVSLAECKPVLDEMLLSGINHVYFQGSPYSPKDAPWPGWQFYASINVTPYNTFWHDINSFDTYIGRVQSFLQKGQPDNDALLYWPVQDVWAMKTRNILLQLTIGNASEWLDPTYFHQVAAQLMRGGYGFDYISDLQLQKTQVKNGMLQTPGTSYQTLIIPPCHFMPEKTLEHILALAKAGAKIIFLDHFPKDVPGLYQLVERRKTFYRLEKSVSSKSRFTNNIQQGWGKGRFYLGNDVNKLMQMAGAVPEGFAASGLQYIRRKTSDGYIYFVADLDDTSANQWIPLAKNISSAVFYDASSGNIGKAAIRKKNGQSEIYIQLQPGQSVVIKGYAHKNITGPAWHYIESAGNPIPLKENWMLTFEKGPEGLKEIMPYKDK
ncbi:MAG: glycosyl hydrolase, partial [Chitinophagaceae bacterium]